MFNYKNIDVILEIIGTISFASSGAMIGIRKKMDIFGVIVLGVVTALGGGCTRDIVLGIEPPSMFVDSFYAILAVMSSVILFVIFYFNVDLLKSNALKIYEEFMIILDAIGLGAFTVTGINTAMALGYTDDKFLLIFVGMVTAIGGGIIRDIFSNSVPFVFKEQIYAMSSFIGAVFYIYFRYIIPADLLMIFTAIIVFASRMIAVKFDLQLPKIHFD
ncbi:trimeric intracellular cation channel family protein [Peptoniphilus stercorisuis]|uniref:Membrane protein YeiH n=1 Tax=Peptoniphilus stercorisuis TaxID=1436965 RepID=A0ABS4KDD1_9FIRM|nr:trimeric intracellular cation channel family protein [Peptoniphilus stercorisuis]MBP2025783.1 putative membrane protein YeiH [Peptoniphilus stercorisuis]